MHAQVLNFYSDLTKCTQSRTFRETRQKKVYVSSSLKYLFQNKFGEILNITFVSAIFLYRSHKVNSSSYISLSRNRCNFRESLEIIYIYILRGKKDATTFFPISLFRESLHFSGVKRKEYSCDYRVYTRKIYIIRGKLKNFKVLLELL